MNIYMIYDKRDNELLCEGMGDEFRARKDIEMLHDIGKIPYKYMEVKWLKSIIL